MFQRKMWNFTEIPPNKTVVETFKEKRTHCQFGPDHSQMTSKIEISTDVQKTRKDYVEQVQKFENGKEVTTTKQIITRVFTVRQEINQGM